MSEALISLHEQPKICYERSCLRSLRKHDDRVNEDFLNMIERITDKQSSAELNLSRVDDTHDKSFCRIKLNAAVSAIASVQGSTLIFLYVDHHKDACRWAQKRKVKFDLSMGRVRIIIVGSDDDADVETFKRNRNETGLFDCIDNVVLQKLGLSDIEIAKAKAVTDEDSLMLLREQIDATSFDMLCALHMGHGPDDIPKLLGGADLNDREINEAESAVSTDSGQAHIFVPQSESELRRELDGDAASWRVFLHPEQRRIAYRNYNGPALVRGGAGTGKTVVAMHRARYLADNFVSSDKQVLLTTFTKTLARDIAQSLKTLCPEHLRGNSPRIEVINIDAWAKQYLLQRNFRRKLVPYGGNDQTKSIWDDVESEIELPHFLSLDFAKTEWATIIQPKGIETREDYFRVSRAGRGTPLSRRNRARLWPLFEAFRARMQEHNLAEPDDMYREAIALIKQGSSYGPYAAVVVDETQDMGEQAIRLIAAIAKKSDQKDSLFLVGDAHQRIYDRKSSLKACGIDVRGRSRRLRLNYRTPDKIRKWGLSILNGIKFDDLDDGRESSEGYRSLILGRDPIRLEAASRSQELSLIADQILSAGNAANVCVLVRTNQLVDAVVRDLRTRGLLVLRIEDDMAEDTTKEGVRVATMHRAKGLEFDDVFLACLDSDIIPPKFLMQNQVDALSAREIAEREKSLLHVAATRAKKRLYLSWIGRPTDLIPVLQT